LSEREKINATGPDPVTGPAFLSVPRDLWNRMRADLKATSQGPDFGNAGFSSELHGLLDVLLSVRKRILANTVLRRWMKSWTWILAGLIVAASISPKLAWVVILAAILAGIGVAFAMAWTWRARPSAYEIASRVDSAAGLRDRLSTAVHFGVVEQPDAMMLRQRQDALSRVPQLNATGLFPIQFPASATRILALAVVASGLFAYRVYHKPPIIALLQSTARSQLVQSILSPITNAMEKDLQRTVALVNTELETPADEVHPGDDVPVADDLWQPEKDKGSKADAKDAMDANFGDPDKSGNPDQNKQGDMKSGDQQQGDPQQSQDGNGNEGKPGDSQQKESQNGSESKSLSQSLKQALKDMMSKSKSDQAKQQADAQKSQQGGDSHQPPNADSNKKSDSQGSSDAQQKASPNSASGAGTQQGSKDLKKDQVSSPDPKGTPDRIGLEATGFKEQTRVRVDPGTGTAKLAVRDVTTQGMVVTNGAEQENIPARYRLYVQHYFEHANSDQK